MKLDKETLKRIIKEELENTLEEGDRLVTNPRQGPLQITTVDPSLTVDQTDPNDGLFQIMDKIADKAMEKLGMSEDDKRYREAEDLLLYFANELVTERLQDIEQMANGVVARYVRHQERVKHQGVNK